MKNKTTPIYYLRNLRSKMINKLNTAGYSTVESLMSLIGTLEGRQELAGFLNIDRKQVLAVEFECRSLLPELNRKQY
jgi:hypothetical protein